MKSCFQYHPETTVQTVTTKEDNTEDKNEIVDEVAREPTLFAPTMPPKEENKEAVGTKEAAAKASKELEGSLAKLGNNISKADAMAIAEQVKEGKSFLQNDESLE